MEYIPLSEPLTPARKRNLATLAAFLETNAHSLAEQDKFDMGAFRTNIETDRAIGYLDPIETLIPENICGTAGCAVGWAPIAGVKPFKDEGWGEYSNRALCADQDAWEYMFDEDWAMIDNTPQGAAERIREVLNHGGTPATGWYGAPQDDPDDED